MVDLLYNRKNFALISKTLCFSQAFVCLKVVFHQELRLGVNICGLFNAVSNNISSYKTYKSTKSPIVLQNHLANVQKNQMSLGNGIMRLATRISNFSCCLYSAQIVCIRSVSFLKRRLFLQSAVTSVAATRSDKRLLFVIYVVVA